LCTYYIKDTTTNLVTSGQHYTHSVPLQFYTFNKGTLDRFSGSSSSFLSHETTQYTYIDGIFNGTLISGGTSAPGISLTDSYMCVYDTMNINGVECYVEYALIRVFDSPAEDNAIITYASAVESGGIALPQYTSTVMENPSVITTTTNAPTSQVSATYGMIGTWLLATKTVTQYGADGQPTGSPVTTSVADRTMVYNYVIFRMDGSYVVYTLEFSDDMSECLEKSSSKGYYEFNDGLLSFKPASSKTAVTAGGERMYFEYSIENDGVTSHCKDTYIFISSDEYGYNQLIPLRPQV